MNTTAHPVHRAHLSASSSAPFGEHQRTWRQRTRLSLHSLGLATKIDNLVQWRAHLFERLSHQIAATADPALVALLEELRGLPVLDHASEVHLEGEHPGVVVPLKYRTPSGVLSFISTTTIFGTPVDVTLQELALETFFPQTNSPCRR